MTGLVGFAKPFGLAQCRVGSTGNMWDRGLPSASMRLFTHFTWVGIPCIASKVGLGVLYILPKFAPVIASLASPPYPQTLVCPKPVGLTSTSTIGSIC